MPLVSVAMHPPEQHCVACGSRACYGRRPLNLEGGTGARSGGAHGGGPPRRRRRALSRAARNVLSQMLLRTFAVDALRLLLLPATAEAPLLLMVMNIINLLLL